MKRRLAWIAALIAELIAALIATRWTLAPKYPDTNCTCHRFADLSSTDLEARQ